MKLRLIKGSVRADDTRIADYIGYMLTWTHQRWWCDLATRAIFTAPIE